MKKLGQRSGLFQRLKAAPVLVIAILLAVGGTSYTVVHADVYQQHIDALSSQNAQKQSSVDSLESQAKSYQDAINKLRDEIAGIQNAITLNKNKQAQIQAQIEADQKKLDYEKQVLGEDLKAMYVGGQMTTVEMLATSKNLSDFVDAETYDSAVQGKIQDTLNQITALQNKLEQQKNQVNQLLSVEQEQSTQLDSDRVQQQQLLSYNQQQQDNYNSQIQANQKKIATLRAEQLAANERLDSSGQVITSGSCGGSYPASAISPYGGHWGCNYGLDNAFDNWAMDNRECVSYTAWMVYQTYGISPTGFGNANMWPGKAQAAGIPTGSTPKVGSVAIYMGNASTDPWGHAMWVVGVSGNEIHVYSYNDEFDGNFYDHWVSSSGLTYIYFGE